MAKTGVVFCKENSDTIPRQILDTCAERGWLLSTAEIAEIIGLNPNAITARGNSFEHDIWAFERIKRQGNRYVWSVSRLPAD